MRLNDNFIKKFDGSFSTNVKLSNYSWFNLGGNAEYFYKAKNKTQLLEFLNEAKKRNLKNGSINFRKKKQRIVMQLPLNMIWGKINLQK